MTKILTQKNINLFLLIFSLLIIKSIEVKPYKIKRLRSLSIYRESWDINKSYIYYIDISNYQIGKENVFQILSEMNRLMHNLTVSEIDESIIFDNKSEIIKKETYKRAYHIKLRPKPKRYYYEVLIKKSHINQTYFVILIEPNIYQNNTIVDLTVSRPVFIYNITKNDISDGNIFARNYFFNAKIEQFFRFNFHNVSLEKQNLIILVGDNSISNFYFYNISSKAIRTKLLIINKNSTNETNFVIYLSLLGPSNKTRVQITLDEHDVYYSYSSDRNLTSFYTERLNCSKDYYIFQNYINNVDDKLDQIYHLDINSIYGDYNIIYYENIGSNITNIFKPDNDTMEILNENYIKKVSGEITILKLSCKTPTLLKINYFSENINLNLNISEGQEKIVHLDRPLNYDFIYKNNYIKMTDVNKKYQFYFGYYKLKETSGSKIKTILNTAIGGYDKVIISDNPPYIIIDSYYEKNKPEKYFSVEVFNNNMYYKLYLISNQFYKNVVEGLTKIDHSEKAIAFKIRKDIPFDFFIFKSYSYNKQNSISLSYDLKIAKENNIEKDKVMLSISLSPIREINKKEINIRFSNPYDKFNSKIQDGDFVYLLVKFLSLNSTFPIYIDIRYYYNNSIITLEPSGNNILLKNEEYKIYGKNDNNFEKILLNINKCNISKNYTIQTFYENNNNLLLIENITNERTFLFHDNLFNNTKIIFHNNNEYNNNYDDNILQQASYYKTGDLYMNYFPVKENIYNELTITRNFSIRFEDTNNITKFEWNDYITNKKGNITLNYSIYIFPKSSPINSICQMALIPPNISLINQNKYEIYLDKGEYKMSIIASIINKDFPLTTYYDFLEFKIPKKYNIELIIIFCSSGLIIIIVSIFLIIYCKKRQKNELDDLINERKSRLLSVAKVLGINDEQEEIIINNDFESNEDNEKYIINSDISSKKEDSDNLSKTSNK